MKEYFAKLKYLFRWRDMGFAVVVLAVVVVMAFCSGENMMTVTFGEEAVDVVTDRYTLNIPYNMVESIEIAEISKDDEQIDGRSDLALRTGAWKHERWGEYYGCMDLQTKTCILVHLKDGRLFVFSHESDKTVQAEYEEFLTHLQS